MFRTNALQSTAKFFSIVFSFFVIWYTLAATNPLVVNSQFTQIITRISIDDSGVQGNNTSREVSIDEDGSHVAFSSLANNLVDDDTNIYEDIFVYEASTGSITRVSESTAGTQANGASDSPSISGDGRFVTFASAASNLVVDDTNSVKDIFVYDLELETIERVSIEDGGDEGNNHSQYPTISDDGRYIVFQSAATNLVASDTNNFIDIFLHDRNTDTTTRLSLDSADGESDGHSLYPAISGDGQFVAFNSVATDLVAGDTNSVGDVFLRDLNTDSTTRISVHTAGTEADGRSEHPSIDEIGRYIAYESEASNLVDGDSNSYRDVFVRDTHLNVTQRVSVSSTGAEGNNISGDTVDKPNGRLSANGQYVAFKSRASNLVDGDTNGIVDVFVFDRQTGQTARVSTDSLGTEANDASYYPSISDDGRYIGFWSYATNLVSGDTNGVGDVFVYDRDSLTPTLTPTPTPVLTVTPSSSSSVTLEENTSTPTEVTISTSAGTVYVRCENVIEGGDLTVQVYNTPPGQLTSGFTILPTNFDLSTSDVVCDYITVCLPYDIEEANSVGIAESDLQLWHFMDNWENVTTTIDTLNDRACGVVDELSPFVIGVNTSVTGIPTSTIQVNNSTPSSLPNSGINAPTFGLLLGGILILAGGFYLLVQPKIKS